MLNRRRASFAAAYLLLFSFCTLSAQNTDSAQVMQRLSEIRKLKPSGAADSLRVLLGSAPVRSSRYLQAETLNLLGSKQFEQSLYRDARDTLALALRIARQPDYADTMLVSKILLNLGIVYGNLGNFLKELQLLEQARDLRLRLFGPNHESINVILANLGPAFLRANRLIEARNTLRILIAARARTQGADNERLIGPHINLAIVLKNLAHYDSARIVLKEAERISALHYKPGSMPYANILESYANLEDLSGNFENALEYHLQAMKIRREHLGPGHVETAHSHFNAGSMLKKIGRYEQAAQELETAYGIYKNTLGAAHPSTADCLSTIADVFAKQGQANRAEALFRAALDTLIASNMETETLADGYNSLGYFYLEQNQPDKALPYLRQALDHFRELFDNRHVWVAELYLHLGQAHQQKGEWTASDSLLTLSLQTLRFDLHQPDFNTCFNPWLTHDPLLLLGRNAAARGDIPEALRYFDLCQQLGDYLRALYRDQHQQLGRDFLQKKELEIATALFNAAFVEGKLRPGIDSDLLFRTSGRCKAVNLLESIRDAGAQQFGEVPDSLIARERLLLSRAVFYRAQWNELRNSGVAESDSAILELIGLIRSSDAEYAGFKKALEEHYPRYFELKYQGQPMGLSFTRDSLLKAGQTLLEFVRTDQSAFVFVVRRDAEVAIHQLTMDDGVTLDALVKDLRRSLTQEAVYHPYSPVRRKAAADAYTDVAFRLYQLLLKPVESLLTDTLIIIPDGVLGYVPFDVLLKEKPAQSTRFRGHAYLGSTKRISYAYSTALLWEMQKKKHSTRPESGVLAMAPFSHSGIDGFRDPDNPGTKDELLGPLPSSGGEALDVRGIFNGTAFLGAAATWDQLFSESGNHKIIHLSTHGKADDKVGAFAWLAFAMPEDSMAFKKVFLKDIYRLRLNADLVTLSACETGIGELQRGEGIISLARAFAYSGAKSIVTTLWSVSDAHTRELMRRFNENLQAGWSKDYALWKAKKDFLDAQPNDDNGAHPYFWAGFIPVGDMVGVLGY